MDWMDGIRYARFIWLFPNPHICNLSNVGERNAKGELNMLQKCGVEGMLVSISFNFLASNLANHFQARLLLDVWINLRLWFWSHLTNFGTVLQICMRRIDRIYTGADSMGTPFLLFVCSFHGFLRMLERALPSVMCKQSPKQLNHRWGELEVSEVRWAQNRYIHRNKGYFYFLRDTGCYGAFHIATYSVKVRHWRQEDLLSSNTAMVSLMVASEAARYDTPKSDTPYTSKSIFAEVTSWEKLSRSSWCKPIR